MNFPRLTAWYPLVLLAFAVGCNGPDSGNTSFPAKPIKLVVPFAAGGGSDQFARILTAAIEDRNLLPEKLVVINVPGAGGTIGSRRVKNARPDGYTLLLLHEGMMTAKYSGRAAYGPEAFESVVGSGDTTQVIAVSNESRFGTLSELMTTAAESPDEIVFAANIGAPSHFAGLMLEQQQPGASFRFTQTGGGAKRFAAIQGGHVSVTSFSLSEYLQFRPAGIRAIALLSDRRNQELPELATASEQGFDVISKNMQFWWAPKGTPADRLDVIAKAISQAMQDETVRRTLAQLRIEPRVLRGEELSAEIEIRSRRLAEVASLPDTSLPNIPRITLIITLLLAVAVGVRAWLGGPNVAPTADVPTPLARLTLLLLTLTVAYVATLQATSVGFRVATFLFIILSGSMLYRFGTPGEPNRRDLSRFAIVLGTVAISLSLGLHFVFTRVLVVDLP